jgi:1,4-alpha-glucan branching enzyme
MNSLTERIICADHHDPFVLLGVHFDEETEGYVTVRTLQPNAQKVELLTDDKTYSMEREHLDGLFATRIERHKLSDPDLAPFNYRFRVTYLDGTEHLWNDPYRFLPQLDKNDSYLFNYGTNYRMYDHFGAHLRTIESVSGTLFRVWAPAARRVSVIGNFNGWDGRVHAMRNLGSSGIWELFIPGVYENELYKFEVKAQNGDILTKSDPVQFFGENRPNTASIVRDIESYHWNDQEWQELRAAKPP